MTKKEKKAKAEKKEPLNKLFSFSAALIKHSITVKRKTYERKNIFV